MNSVNHNKVLKPIPCVQISHVTKRFGEDLVLKEVNLDLNYGQVYGIVGNNGSGKTVLMKCICGFLPATTGTIHVSGKQIGKDTDFPESLGVIIETPGFLTQYTGMKNLEILANLKLFERFDLPLLLAASRKSVIGLTLDLPVTEREEGTMVTSVLAGMAGWDFVRVHDVEKNKRALKMLEKILGKDLQRKNKCVNI